MFGTIINVLGSAAQSPVKANLLSFDGPDIFVLLLIVLLLFGPKNLPKLARSIGSSVKELKKGLNGEVSDEKEGVDTTTAQPAAKSEAKRPAPTSPVTSEGVKEDDSHTTTV